MKKESENNKKSKTTIKRKTTSKSTKSLSKTKNYDTKYDTKNIKKRIPPKETKKDTNIKIICCIILVAILILCYLTLGIEFTLITAIGIGIIIGVAELLKKVKNQKRKRRVLNVILIIILTLGILGLAGVTAFLLYIRSSAEPKFKAEELNTPELTALYDINGEEYAKLGSEQREKVTYDELPEVLIDAIVATEDSRFFQHNGFDAPRFLKASIGQLLGNSNAGGASTLSMQVVKNTFTNAEIDEGIEGIIRKFEDIYLAIFKLEKNYTKQQIIEFYVNNHFLGGNIYGVEEASEKYFGKKVSELNLSEAAVIAGMFKSPNSYNPITNPENAEKRRSTVLYLMRTHGYITKEEEEIANSIPVSSLTADSEIKENQYQGYIDTVYREVKEKYGIDIYTTPVLVYTNLDRTKQEAVESVLNGENYTWIDDKVQAGISVVDSQTGKILAIGAGRNKTGAKQLNYATGIRRQPGSTAKPLFDYGPGIEYNNWSTYTLFDDSPYSYSNGQSIKNWDGGYFGTITLRRALATSRNIPALKAFQQVDNKKIIEFVTSLGIEPEIENGRIHEAHAIGAFEPGVSSLQMAAAYAAFSNGGYYNKPYSVSKIVFRSTGETKEHQSEKTRVMSDATAFMISDVLQDVALTGGTPTNVAAKTGTTNYDDATMERENLPSDAIRDSWVVGYSTKTVIGMWYGYDYIDSEYCLHNVPATIQKDRLFNALVSAGAMESNREAFKQPSSVVKLGIVAGSNPPKIAGAGYTGSVVYEYFKKGYEPEETTTEQTTLAKPSNFKVSYDESTNKVTMSWNAVNPGDQGDSSYGTFGYNIYLDSTLIAFTDKTSYTFTTTNPYGTYKIVATYKSYSGLQSEAATYTLKETTTPSPSESPEPTTSPSPTPTTTPSPSPTPTTTPTPTPTTSP